MINTLIYKQFVCLLGNAAHTQSKPEWKRYKQYTREDIQGAIQAVKTGMSAVQAARLYNVPSRTLYDKVKKLGIPTSRPLKQRSSNGDNTASFPFGGNVNGRIYTGSMLSKNENENNSNVNFENLSTSMSSANTYDAAYKPASKDTSQDHDSMPEPARYSPSPVICCTKQKQQQQQNVDDEVEDLSVNRKSDVPVIRLTSDTVKDEPQETGPNNSDCGDYC